MTSVAAMTVTRLRLSAVCAKERHEPQAEHVKRSQECRDQSHQPVRPTRLIRTPQNFIFTEKSGESWNTCNGQSACRHRPESPRDLLAQPAHLAHILLAAHRVDHRARTKEKQSLEECMRHQVKNARGERAHAARHEHVSQLRHGRVRQNLFDIGLCNANRRREESSHCSNDGYHGQRDRSAFENHMRPRNHVHARRHHRRRVDQCRNRRRTFHRIRQPYIQGNLR